MGYYSTVAIKVEDEAFKKYFKNNKTMLPWAEHYILNKNYIDFPIHYLIWDWAKWYTEFEEIAEIENIVDILIEKNEEGCQISYCKIGEEDCDIEHRCSDDFYDYYVSMSRGFEIEEGFELIESTTLNDYRRKYLNFSDAIYSIKKEITDNIGILLNDKINATPEQYDKAYNTLEKLYKITKDYN